MRMQFTFHKGAVAIMKYILIIILSSFGLPEVQAQERNFKDLPDPVRVISLDDYNIYSPISLAIGGDGKSYGTVIDIYQISTGEYSHSFEVENRGIAVAANDKTLSLIQQKEDSFEI